MSDLNGMKRGAFSERKIVVKKERFQIPLFIACLLLFMEFSFLARKKITPVFFPFFFLFFNHHAQAGQIDMYLENQKGLEAFQQGKMDEAKKHFGAAQAQDPTSPELMYNQGVVQTQEEDYASALQGFQGASEWGEKNNRPDISSQAQYNLGSLYSKTGDLQNGIQNYLKALENAKKIKNPELEELIRKKLQKLVEQQQQKKNNNQDQKDQDKKNQDKQDKSDQQNQQENKQDQQSNDSQKNQNKKFKDPSQDRKKNQFESKKLSKEDADRVMAELSQKEKDLKSKLQKRNAPRGERKGKDW